MNKLKEYIQEKLIINKHSKVKKTFYEFTEYPEENKILTICGFNDSNNKPSNNIINGIRRMLYDIWLQKNEEIFALVDKYTYNLLDNNYHISNYKDYIIIDDKLYEEYYNDRFMNISHDHSIMADYHIYSYEYGKSYGKNNKLLISDDRNPDEVINVFFIKKSKK